MLSRVIIDKTNKNYNYGHPLNLEITSLLTNFLLLILSGHPFIAHHFIFKHYLALICRILKLNNFYN